MLRNKGLQSIWCLFLMLVLVLGLPSAQAASAQQPVGDQPLDQPAEIASARLSGDVFSARSADQSPALVTSRATAGDADGDGLTDAQEAALGTDLLSPDSDCDYLSDSAEVGTGAAPIDSDGDGIIDALESNLADSNKDGKKDNVDPAIVPQFSCGTFKPFAIRANTGESARLEVRIMGGTNVTAVTLDTTTADYGLLDGSVIQLDGTSNLKTLTEVALYDDGTHGDRVAGDHIWTRNNFTGKYVTSYYFRYFYTFYKLKVTDNGAQSDIALLDVLPGVTFSGINLGLGYNIPEVTLQDNGGAVQVSGNFINIVDPLASLVLKDSLSGGVYSAAKLFYHYYFDNYDFLFFFPDAPAMNQPYGYSIAAKNDVQNIGMNIFDKTSSFGSAGKLQNVLFMNMGSSGPTLHEIMHRWGVPGAKLKDLGFIQCSPDNAHWGVSGVGVLPNKGGQLGGFTPANLVPNPATYTYTLSAAFGLNANGGDGVPYAPLEMYLAGWIPASQVPDITLPNMADCPNLGLFPSGSVYSIKTTNQPGGNPDGMKKVTIADVQAALGGERIPAAADAQKDYKAAFVMISARKLNATEMAMFNRWAEILSGDGKLEGQNSFKAATGGMGTIDTAASLPPVRYFYYLPVARR